MAEIKLLRRDGTVAAVTLVSDEDYAYLSQWTWRLSAHGRAHRGSWRDGRYVSVYLAREVLGLPAGGGDARRGLQADHVNGDPLDNRRENLRAVTPGGNGQNVHVGWGASRYRGVVWDGSRKKWKAKVGRKQLGRFDTEEEAARVAAAYRAEHLPLSVI